MGILVDVFCKEIADSENKLLKLIMSFNTAKHSEIQTIYHVDPEEELLMTFEDDSMEEIPTSAIAKTSTAKGNGKYSAQ